MANDDDARSLAGSEDIGFIACRTLHCVCVSVHTVNFPQSRVANSLSIIEMLSGDVKRRSGFLM